MRRWRPGCRRHASSRRRATASRRCARRRAFQRRLHPDEHRPASSPRRRTAVACVRAGGRPLPARLRGPVLLGLRGVPRAGGSARRALPRARRGSGAGRRAQLVLSPVALRDRRAALVVRARRAAQRRRRRSRGAARRARQRAGGRARQPRQPHDRARRPQPPARGRRGELRRRRRSGAGLRAASGADRRRAPRLRPTVGDVGALGGRGAGQPRRRGHAAVGARRRRARGRRRGSRAPRRRPRGAAGRLRGHRARARAGPFPTPPGGSPGRSTTSTCGRGGRCLASSTCQPGTRRLAARRADREDC
jgi:hypothetical protein